MIGRTLSHFEITAKLGEGGMGEVWRARDTRLGREVAIKVLSEAFTTDAERLARFEREARVLASLNHPNIGGIYDLVESDGVRALVLELVEGPTLAERIALEPIPVDEALPIARQIADALEAAHGLGIVHRDLKPANIKFTPENKVKVLDFGLARAMQAESEPETAGLSQSPTADHATRLGTILGTASYMAPEQARGLPADRRADLWAFGCVLYEMLTGVSPFGGATHSDTLAAVLRAEPSWQPLPDATPRAVRRLLERCLRKDVERRLRDAGDARLELEDAKREPEVAAGPATAAPVGRRGTWLPVAIAALTTILALGLLLERLVRPQAVERPIEFEIHPPPGTTLSTWIRARPVVSPDGSHIVFSVMQDSGERLWVRRLDNLEAWPLKETEGAVGPFWSPDSRLIGFAATSWRGLRRIDLGGGAPELMTRESATGGSSWSRAGEILTSTFGPLRRVYTGEGGWTSEPLSSLDPSRQEFAHTNPEFLPDGEHFLFFVESRQVEHTGTFVASLTSPDSRRRVVPASSASYGAPGHVLFAQEGTLLARPFDLGRLEASGEPIVIVDQLAMLEGKGMFSVSRDGVLAYRRSLDRAGLAWFDREGNRLAALSLPEGAQSPELSPDEERLAFERRDPKTGWRDLWIWDFDRRAPTKLTTHSGDDSDPVWSPDGDAILFTSTRDGRPSLYRKQVGSATPPDLVLREEGADFGTNWSPDGEHVLFTRWPAGGAEGKLFLLPLSGNDVAKRMLDTDSQEGLGQFSPDGQWIAYMTGQTGRDEVYIQPFPQTGEVIQISTGGGGMPRWRGDGAEIYYLDLEGWLMAVALSSTESGLLPSPPKKLFQPDITHRGFIGVRYTYDVSSDGQRFLVSTETTEARPSTIVVVTDWTGRLER